jgi:hypothetical protein
MQSIKHRDYGLWIGLYRQTAPLSSYSPPSPSTRAGPKIGRFAPAITQESAKGV